MWGGDSNSYFEYLVKLPRISPNMEPIYAKTWLASVKTNMETLMKVRSAAIPSLFFFRSISSSLLLRLILSIGHPSITQHGIHLNTKQSYLPGSLMCVWRIWRN